MKKLVALLLAVMMVMGLFAACSGNTEETQGTTTEATTEGTTEATTEATTEGTTEGEVAADSNASAEILGNIWNKYADEEKFPVMGGAPETYAEMIEIDENYMMPEAPAAYDMKYAESLTSYLCIPADQLANIDEVGFVQHGMMINNFACGVVHVTSDAQAFADTMRDAIKNNMWMCGQPEKLLIAVIDSEYVLVGYGLDVALAPMATHLTEAYADAQILYNENVVE